MKLSELMRDCKECVNCCSVHGFMCTCRYSYDDGKYHHQVGQDVHRAKANTCAYYKYKKPGENPERKEIFPL